MGTTASTGGILGKVGLETSSMRKNRKLDRMMTEIKTENLQEARKMSRGIISSLQILQMCILGSHDFPNPSNILLLPCFHNIDQNSKRSKMGSHFKALQIKGTFCTIPVTVLFRFTFYAAILMQNSNFKYLRSRYTARHISC